MAYRFLAVVIIMTSCGGDGGKTVLVTEPLEVDGARGFAVSEREVALLYNDALDQLYDESYLKASELFEEVDREYPYSAWSANAQLMAAFSYYMANDFDDAVVALDQFVNFNPSHRSVPYALYLKAMCYFEQIKDVEREQEKTLQALAAFDQLINRYEDTPYGRDGRRRVAILVDNLAGKEMDIGRFYLGQGEYLAALNRFNQVLEDYGSTLHAVEALHRLVEAYVGLGLHDEAWRVAAILGHNFPDSDWYNDSYALLAKNGLLEGDAKRERLSIESLREQDRLSLGGGGGNDLKRMWHKLLEAGTAQKRS